jgi:mRNA interferase RelE/StbE
MKAYQVQVDKQVFKFFRRLPLKQAAQLKTALQRLGDNPRPQDCKKLVDTGGYRLTVGEFRILYTIDDEAASVNVYRIAKRNDFSY